MNKRATPIHDRPITRKLIAAARKLRDDVDGLSFADPVTHVYNPLQYAWKAHRAYLQRVNPEGVEVLFLGMNPGPWGMAQTGVPFGEIEAVRNWIGVETTIDRPRQQHPKRPIEGFACRRSEVSGRRLWGLFQERFTSPDRFFAKHFVTNYCPLVFMEQSARNRTPDKLPTAERDRLDEVCDKHLQKVLQLLTPVHVVGVGAYAERCLDRVISGVVEQPKLTRILHPSPASPAANRDWSGTVTRQLERAGIW